MNGKLTAPMANFVCFLIGCIFVFIIMREPKHHCSKNPSLVWTQYTFSYPSDTNSEYWQWSEIELGLNPDGTVVWRKKTNE